MNQESKISQYITQIEQLAKELRDMETGPGGLAGQAPNHLRVSLGLILTNLRAESQDSDEDPEVLKRQIEHYRQLLQGRDKLFSIIAHDLKGPFNGILGFSEVLKDQAKSLDSETIVYYASIIYGQSFQAWRLVENLLIWTRIQQGRIHFKPAVHLLKKLSQDVILSFHDSAQNKNVSVANSIPEQMVGKVDADMWKVILSNLVHNAIKYSYPGGRVEIGTTQNDHKLVVWVSDTGTGMPAEMVKKLGIEGEYTTERGTGNEKGSGLGLVLCREFILRLGGELNIESEAGKGSRFTIVLPRLSE